jgi:hypothetical protein
LLGGEGGIESEYNCLNVYKETSKVKETADEFNLDDDIILQLLHSFLEHIEEQKRMASIHFTAQTN